MSAIRVSACHTVSLGSAEGPANGAAAPPATAYDHWESGFWGTQPNPDLDSAFSKLESYGLVPRTGPPNNLNIFTDFQNWFALLPKGLRFAESKSYADAEST